MTTRRQFLVAGAAMVATLGVPGMNAAAPGTTSALTRSEALFLLRWPAVRPTYEDEGSREAFDEYRRIRDKIRADGRVDPRAQNSIHEALMTHVVPHLRELVPEPPGGFGQMQRAEAEHILATAVLVFRS